MTQQLSGIVGNTSQQQVTATTSRHSTMRTRMLWAGNIGFAILAVGVGVILANAGLSFWWKLVVAIALIFASDKLGNIKSPVVTLWSKIIKSVGWIVLVIVLLLSGFGTWIGSSIDTLEASATSASVKTNGEEIGIVTQNYSECSNKRIEAEVGKVFIQNKSCPVFFDSSALPDGFNIFPINADIASINVSKWNETHTGAKDVEFRLDPVEEGFVGFTEVAQFIIEKDASEKRIDELRKKLTSEMTKDALAGTL